MNPVFEQSFCMQRSYKIFAGNDTHAQKYDQPFVEVGDAEHPDSCMHFMIGLHAI